MEKEVQVKETEIHRNNLELLFYSEEKKLQEKDLELQKNAIEDLYNGEMHFTLYEKNLLLLITIALNTSSVEEKVKKSHVEHMIKSGLIISYKATKNGFEIMDEKDRKIKINNFDFIFLSFIFYPRMQKLYIF